MATDLKMMQNSESMTCVLEKESVKNPILIAVPEFSVILISPHTPRILTPYFSPPLITSLFPS